MEFLRCCHNVLSRQLRVRTPSDSTTGEIPIPKGKHCPTRLERWVDCAVRQQDIYNSVRHYLQPQENAPRLFPPQIVLDGLSEHFKGPMGAEYDLQTYERLAVEDHTRYIFLELCKIPAAREEFGLGDGVLFDSHPNILSDTEIVEKGTKDASATPRGKPDQLFIHRVGDRTTTLLTTVEYKPPHKLPLEDIRRGLRDMDLWKEMVWSNKVPNDEAESLVYNSQRLVCSAIVQEYHVMIQEGLEYSYLTTGMALVLLQVPYDKPSTLYYYLCEPNQEVDHGDGDLHSPNTAIARVLCLCLMSFCSQLRNQEWRNEYCRDLEVWTTQFDGLHETVCSRELQQNPHSDDTNYVSPISPATSPEFLESSSPVESPRAPARRVPTRSQGSCAPSDLRDRTGSLDSSGSESDYAVSGRKRGFSQVEVSPSQRLSRQNERDNQRDISQRQHAQFCTQRCLLGLQNGGTLDNSCPNVHIHRQSGDGVQHPINAAKLVLCLKQQIDENIDRCIPFGTCGSYGAPFKLTCSPYGYTVVGKGTTSGLWQQHVSREAEIYQILLKAQGSAVPVFFGKMDLAKIYFLHGAGQIRHMLVMGWAGESTAKLEQTAELRREIKRSKKKIRALGVRHLDLRPDNILWNAELGRALIIDFHRCELDCRPATDRSSSLKRRRRKVQMSGAKRVRVI